MHSIRNDRDGRENVYAPSECLTDRAHRVAMGKLYPPTISTAGPALRRVGSYTLALLIKVVNRFISDTLPSAIKTFCRIASFGMPRRRSRFVHTHKLAILTLEPMRFVCDYTHTKRN